jgi:hypothetical protein
MWSIAAARRYNREANTSMMVGSGRGQERGDTAPEYHVACIASQPRLPSIPVSDDETLSMNTTR